MPIFCPSTFAKTFLHSTRYVPLISFVRTRTIARVFSPRYLPPLFNLKDLEEVIKSGKIDEMSVFPFLPASSTQSCSLYYDLIYEKLLNRVMKYSNKELARELVEDAFQEIKLIQLKNYAKAESDIEREAIILDPLKVLHAAVKNGSPKMKTRKVLKGAAAYQVPFPLKPEISLAICIKALVEAGRERVMPTKFYQQLAYEIVDASNNEGKIIRQKQEMHRICEVNRAYAHFRW